MTIVDNCVHGHRARCIGFVGNYVLGHRVREPVQNHPLSPKGALKKQTACWSRVFLSFRVPITCTNARQVLTHVIASFRGLERQSYEDTLHSSKTWRGFYGPSGGRSRGANPRGIIIQNAITIVLITLYSNRFPRNEARSHSLSRVPLPSRTIPATRRNLVKRNHPIETRARDVLR